MTPVRENQATELDTTADIVQVTGKHVLFTITLVTETRKVHNCQISDTEDACENWSCVQC